MLAKRDLATQLWLVLMEAVRSNYLVRFAKSQVISNSPQTKRND